MLGQVRDGILPPVKAHTLPMVPPHDLKVSQLQPRLSAQTVAWAAQPHMNCQFVLGGAEMGLPGQERKATNGTELQEALMHMAHVQLQFGLVSDKGLSKLHSRTEEGVVPSW